MNLVASHLILLGTLNGRFTEGRLRVMGFDCRAIRRAVAGRLFDSQSSGVLTSIPQWMRDGKLRNLLQEEGVVTGQPPQDYQPGQTVQRVENGQLKNFQVIRTEGGELVLVDPENVAAGEQRATKDDVSPAPDMNVATSSQEPPGSRLASQMAARTKTSRMPYVG